MGRIYTPHPQPNHNHIHYSSDLANQSLTMILCRPTAGSQANPSSPHLQAFLSLPTIYPSHHLGFEEPFQHILLSMAHPTPSLAGSLRFLPFESHNEDASRINRRIPPLESFNHPVLVLSSWPTNGYLDILIVSGHQIKTLYIDC